MKVRIILLVLSVIYINNTWASEKAQGSFEAIRSCEAYSSFSKGRNPGLLKTTPGEKYEIVEINSKSNWDWIRVIMPDNSNELRWVAKDCGKAELEPAQTNNTHTDNNLSGGNCSTPNQYDSYVLAVTWQPGFCEHPPRDNKPECAALNSGQLSITHLTLHGLWPNKKSCGKKYGNCGNTPLNLSEDTKAELAPWMPNFYYDTSFGEHEWSKHGTCQFRKDDEYFLFAKDLVRQIDSSAIGQYIKDNIGASIQVNSYRQYIESKRRTNHLS